MVPPLKPVVKVDLRRVAVGANSFLEGVAKALRHRGKEQSANDVLELLIEIPKEVRHG